jgi:hypothetical protein
MEELSLSEFVGVCCHSSSLSKKILERPGNVKHLRPRLGFIAGLLNIVTSPNF